MFNQSKKIEAAPVLETVPEIIETNPGEFSTVTGMDTAVVASEPEVAASEPTATELTADEIDKAVDAQIAALDPVTVTLSKKQAAKAAKAAKALLALAAASEAPATASEPATLADLDTLPSFAVPGETSTTAPKAARVAAPKAPKVPAEKSANQQIVFALLARDEGATIGDIVAAIGPKGSAISWLRSAAKNGYATRIEKVEGKNRYIARRA